MQVVTYQSPDGVTRLSICRECEQRLRADGEWPRDWRGQELVNVYIGEHAGMCDVHAAVSSNTPKRLD